MTAAKLAFFKLIVQDLPRVQGFYERAFGFALHDHFDTPDFEEVILRQDGTDVMLILLRYKDGRAVPAQGDHGPTGFVTQDMAATHAAVVAAGGRPKGEIMEVQGIRVAFLEDPDGHEIEIIQFPG